MKHLNDTEKYYECRAALEHILKTIRFAYNQGFFGPNQKQYIFNVLREGDITIRKISE
jgi:hypothetical protein